LSAPAEFFRLIIISAPSGSGKTTLVSELRKQVPDLDFSISYTTRPPRGSETSGCEYHFVSRPEFERMIAENRFLEYAEVFGNLYGTSWDYVEKARSRGHDLVLDIDVQGAEKVRAKAKDAVGIFIAPPDRHTLEMRLKTRGLDPPEVVERRLQDASREIAAYNKYDYVVINDDLRDSVERLKAIVLYERDRAGRRLDTIPGRLQLERRAADCRTENVSRRLAPVLRSFGVEIETTRR
jgi:guanylate kinase